MTITVGDHLPQASFMTVGDDGAPAPTSTAEVFGGRTIALFAVPGAFTPTCSAQHMPSFKANADALKAKGVDAIAFTSTNDVFVLKAWAKDQGVDGRFSVLADGNGDFARALGLSTDSSKFGMGMRSKRYAMLVRDGVVEQLNVEESAGAMQVSGAETLLSQM